MLVKLYSVHAVKAYGGTEIWLHSFVTSSLRAGGWSALRPDPLYPVGNNTVTVEQEAGWAPELV